jgi:hypothetical protein
MSHDKVVASARAVLASMHDGNKGQTISSDAGVSGPLVTTAVYQRPTSVSEIVSNAFMAEPGGARQPFFTGLTKALTGKQEAGMLVRQETVPPASTPTPMAISTPTPMPLPTRVIKLRELPPPVEVMPVMPPDPTPLPVLPPEPTPLPVLPGANLREPQPIRPRAGAAPIPGAESVVIPPPIPMSEPTLGRPRESKGSVEIIQRAPVSETVPSAPRQTRGVVTVETLPVLPAPTTLPQR